MKAAKSFLGTAMGRERLRSAVILWMCSAAACSSSNGSSSSSDVARDTTNTNDAASSDDASLGDGRLPPINELNEDAPGGAMSIQCGGQTCMAPAGSPIGLSACCLADGGCGAAPGMFALSAAEGGASACLDTTPGTRDPSCPSKTTMGFPLKGCCSAAGVCGVDLSIIALGCNSSFGGSPGMMTMVNAGPPQPCGDAAGSGPDASGDAAKE